MKIRTFLILCSIIFLFSFSGFCAEDGGLAGYFLEQKGGARALGMGRAFVAVADDSSAILWNPAGLSQVKQQEISTMHIQLFEDTRYEFLGYTLPLSSKLTLGIGGIQLYSSGIEYRDDFNNPYGLFSDQRLAFILGSSFIFSPELFFGLNLKTINHRFDDINTYGTDVDLGLIYQPINFLQIGLNAENIIGSKMERTVGSDKLAFNLKSGLSFNWKEKFIFASDIDFNPYRQIKYHFGMEWQITDIFSLRGGYDAGKPTFGLGIKLDNLQFDYSFLAHNEFGLSQQISFSIRFGEKRIPYELIPAKI